LDIGLPDISGAPATPSQQVDNGMHNSRWTAGAWLAAV